MEAGPGGGSVTNAFRLLVCLGRIDAQGHTRSRDRWSQTPFGFWYVLDGARLQRRGERHERRSQTPFGFWYVLDAFKQKIDNALKFAGHKRLSAFGMSWTLRGVEADLSR